MHSLVSLDDLFKGYIRKYPFLSDPIFLFNPDKIPTKEELLSQNLKDIRYPRIDEARLCLVDLEEWCKNIREKAEITEFPNNTLRSEYIQRIDQIKEIILMIRDFYLPDEQKKCEIITRYFGIDLDYCEQKVIPHKDYIFAWISILQNQCFNLNEEILKDIETTMVDAKEIKRYFEAALVFLGIEQYWQVRIDNKVLAIVHGNFTEHGGVIFIPSSHNISLKRLLLLTIHEIDGHARQFTYFWEYGIYSPIIRSIHSETILEWLAIFLEYSFNALIFWGNSLERSWTMFLDRFMMTTKRMSYDEYIRNYSGNQLFRTFRGFYDISKYTNTKDLIYQQWLYTILSLKDEYGMGIFDAVYSGVINELGIRQRMPIIPTNDSIVDMIKKSSAYYLLTNYFYDKK